MEKIPAIGDPIWWPQKKVGLTITGFEEGMIVAQGGPIIRNKIGRESPRWTLSVAPNKLRWSKSRGFWVCGSETVPIPGPNHVVIRPDPVVASFTSKGSFAVRGY